MHYTTFLTCLLLITACQQPKKETEKPTDSSQATVTELTPVQVVQDLYRTHEVHKGPFFQLNDRALLDRYFTRDLADLIWQDRQRSAKTDEVGLLNGDPLYNAQEMNISQFTIHPATQSGDKAEVRVSFTNFGKPNEFAFLLDKTASGWRIGDILYGDGSQFFQLMSGTAEETP